jgi:uncharacterized protein YhbP (UPF0306 family)
VVLVLGTSTLKLFSLPVQTGSFLLRRENFPQRISWDGLQDMTSELDTIRCVRELLESESTMTLATVDEHGSPDAAPLFFFLRNDLTLYWLSSADSRHSVNLRARPQVAVAVYASVNRWEKIRGVQLEGTATEVSDPQERREIIAGYRRRFRLGALLSAAIMQSTLYAFRPSWIRYTDNSRGFGYHVEMEM